MTVDLSPRQRKFLRGLAHGFEPLVHVGKGGVTEPVLIQIDRVLADHELIKIRFVAGKEEKDTALGEIVRRLGCAEVGRVGHVAVLYRPHAEVEKRKIHLIGR